MFLMPEEEVTALVYSIMCPNMSWASMTNSGRLLG